jgi:hypothetical protein
MQTTFQSKVKQTPVQIQVKIKDSREKRENFVTISNACRK